MICCQSCGYDEFFNEKFATKELKRYRRKGPMPSTRILVERLRAAGVEGATLLDIGGGIGVIQHELLDAGAASAVDIDGSSPYLAIARAEAERRGHTDRSRFELADFVDAAESVEPADIVTLDRVVCCYPDMETLVALSAARARRLYALVYPRERTPWMRLARPVCNTWSRLRRCPLRFYLHPTAEIDRIVREAGLALRERHTTFLWQIAIYERS